MIEETVKTLGEYAARYDAVLVSYSDGKDSRAVMDLCVRYFKRVEAFFMYLVPGLECEAIALEQAEKRWNVTIRRYPHWIGSTFIKNGIYCNPNWTRDDIATYKLSDVYAMAMAETNTRLVATGQKKSDSASRRRLMALSKRTDILHVISEWNRFDVLNYLKMRNIQLPPSAGDTCGVDLTPRSLLWLHDTFPQDFKKLCSFFPYAEAAIWRRTFYPQRST